MFEIRKKLKAFIAERCDYFKTFLHDPFHEIESTNETIRSDSENEKASRKSTAKVVSQLHLKEINSEVLIEIIFFIYSNNFSKDKVNKNFFLLFFNILLKNCSN